MEQNQLEENLCHIQKKSNLFQGTDEGVLPIYIYIPNVWDFKVTDSPVPSFPLHRPPTPAWFLAPQGLLGLLIASLCPDSKENMLIIDTDTKNIDIIITHYVTGLFPKRQNHINMLLVKYSS